MVITHNCLTCDCDLDMCDDEKTINLSSTEFWIGMNDFKVVTDLDGERSWCSAECLGKWIANRVVPIGGE